MAPDLPPAPTPPLPSAVVSAAVSARSVPVRGAVAARPTETSTPPAGRISLDVLRNLAYPAQFVAGGLATLRDGVYREQLVSAAGVRELVVALSDWLVYADVDADSNEDAAVILVSSAGGRAPQFSLAVIAGGPQPHPIATVELSGAMVIEGLQADGSDLVLTTRRMHPADALCCPRLRVQQRLQLRAERLVLVEQSELQLRLAVADPTNASPEPLAIAGGIGGVGIDGVVGPGVVDVYQLNARTGQRLVVQIDSPAGVAAVGIIAPDGMPITPLAAGAQSWEGNLPSGGDYRLLVAAPANTTYRLLANLPEPPPSERPAPPVQMVGGGNAIYLTFDDGPHPTYTPQVLDLLARYGAKATFFVIGRNAAAYPDLVARMLAEGHQVANHTYNHPALAGLGREFFMREVGATQQVLGANAAPCMRPPYGSIDGSTAAYAAELGLSVVMWTIDPADWSRPGTGAIASHVLARAQPGSIILLHDGGGYREQTVAALEAILADLSARGFSFAPVC